ncbi:MAG TPA: hypothetical protein DDZ43_03810 [Hyphomonadaceae bacterium]|nr:hypothetical protein [Hyphomonadaceae bacterium]
MAQMLRRVLFEHAPPAVTEKSVLDPLFFNWRMVRVWVIASRHPVLLKIRLTVAVDELLNVITKDVLLARWSV